MEKTKHSYYCRLECWNSTEPLLEYKTFSDFLEEWENADPDYNLLFRYDIYQNEDKNSNLIDSYRLELFYILQRKGIFLPILVNDFKDTDIEKFNIFIKTKWEYLKNIWEPISKFI